MPKRQHGDGEICLVQSASLGGGPLCALSRSRARRTRKQGAAKGCGACEQSLVPGTFVSHARYLRGTHVSVPGFTTGSVLKGLQQFAEDSKAHHMPGLQLRIAQSEIEGCQGRK